MRPSPCRHPIALLRQEIGMLQKELAFLVNRSPRTIQSIELLKAPLTLPLAEEISEQTGVHSEWLMKGDITIPPYDLMGEKYTKLTFQLTRANIEFGNVENLHIGSLARRFAQLLEDAVRAPDSDLRLSEIHRALKNLEEEDSYTQKQMDDYAYGGMQY